MGLLRRVRGGAEPIAARASCPSSMPACCRTRKLKQAHRAAAAGLVRPGDVLLLDSGTTVLEIARHLPGLLVDNGVLTMADPLPGHRAELRPYRHVQLIVLGGMYLTISTTSSAPRSASAAGSPHADTLFIGTDGVSAERGLTTDNVLEAGLYQDMARSAERVVVVTDSSKIGVTKVQSTLAFSDIQTFITDAGAPADFVAMLQERGCEVSCAHRLNHHSSIATGGSSHVRSPIGLTLMSTAVPHLVTGAAPGPKSQEMHARAAALHEGLFLAGAPVPGGLREGQGRHAHRCGRQHLPRFLVGHLRHRARPLPPQGDRGRAEGGRRADERPRLHHPDQDAPAGEDGRDRHGRGRQEAQRHAVLRLRHRRGGSRAAR